MDEGHGERGEGAAVRAEHRRGKVHHPGDLDARHHRVAAVANFVEPQRKFGRDRRFIAALEVLGDHHQPLLRRAEGEQHLPRAGLEQADMRAHADRDAPVARRFLLRDQHHRAAVEDDELVGLLRRLGEFAHHRRRVGRHPPHRRVEVGQPEQFQRQREPVALVPRHVATPDQRVRACGRVRCGSCRAAWRSRPDSSRHRLPPAARGYPAPCRGRARGSGRPYGSRPPGSSHEAVNSDTAGIARRKLALAGSGLALPCHVYMRQLLTGEQAP